MGWGRALTLRSALTIAASIVAAPLPASEPIRRLPAAVDVTAPAAASISAGAAVARAIPLPGATLSAGATPPLSAFAAPATGNAAAPPVTAPNTATSTAGATEARTARSTRLAPAPDPLPVPGPSFSELDEQIAAGSAANDGLPREAEPERVNPWGPKQGFLQRVLLEETWLEGGSRDELDLLESQSYLTVGVPMPSRRSPLLITPGFQLRLLDGPQALDVPARLYSATCDFRWMLPITRRVTADLALTPGVYSDFRQDASDSFRLSGRAMALVRTRPNRRWALGVVYLNRGNVKLLPAAGLLAQPRDDLRIELFFPQPRVLWRFGDPRRGRWWFVGGEFGGGAWSVLRASGQSDLLSLNDYRLRAGIEQVPEGRLKTWCEIGYVFGRQLTYERSGEVLTLGDALMLRAGVAY